MSCTAEAKQAEASLGASALRSCLRSSDMCNQFRVAIRIHPGCGLLELTLLTLSFVSYTKGDCFFSSVHSVTCAFYLPTDMSGHKAEIKEKGVSVIALGGQSPYLELVIIVKSERSFID